MFYSEPAHQKPALVVHGTREDANPSVNDKLHSYTVTARPRFGPHCPVGRLVPLQFPSSVVSCLTDNLTLHIASQMKICDSFMSISSVCMMSSMQPVMTMIQYSWTVISN